MPIRRTAVMGGTLATALVAAAIGRPWQQGYTLKIGYYGPRTVPVLYAKPQVRLEAWNEQGYLVSKATMTIDGKAVQAAYDPKLKAIIHEPTEPLTPGDHAVACKITLDDQVTFPKNWTLRVAPEAVNDLPSPGPELKVALDRANDLREKTGLPPLVHDPRLSAAAARHAAYCEKNNYTGHAQATDKPGFFGATSGDRAAAYGFPGGTWEGVDSGDESIEDGLKALWVAPYHRLPFLQPGPIPFGAAFAGGRTVTMFGSTVDAGLIKSPRGGETKVPRSWNALEDPDPFRMHDKAPGPTGWPTVVVLWGPTDTRIASATAKMTAADGSEVPIYLNFAGNDNLLSNAVVVTPRKPQTNGATYTVDLKMTTVGGKTHADRWSYTVVP